MVDTAHILMSIGMSSDLSLLCQYHVTSPSGLVTQSHPSSYATRHRKGPFSPLIHCIRLSYDCIPYIHIFFVNMAEWLRPGFCIIFHVTAFMTSDEWFEASLLLQTLESWLYYGWQQHTYIYWSGHTSIDSNQPAMLENLLHLRDRESCWEDKLGSRTSAQEPGWGATTTVG